MFKKFSEKAKEQAEKVKDLKDKLPDIELPNIKFDKVAETVNQLNEIVPLLKEAGFNVPEIETELGIPPTVVIHITLTENSDSQKLLELTQDKGKLAQMVAKGISMALNLQNKIALGKNKLQEIEIEVGIPPKITVHFQE